MLVSLADHPRSCPKSAAPAAVDARPGFLSIRPNQLSQPAPNAPVRSTWLPFLLPDLPCHTLDRPPCQLPNRAGPTCIAPDTRPKYAFPSFFQILYLIGYIAYGLHVWYKIYIFKGIYRKPIFLYPGLGSSLECSYICREMTLFLPVCDLMVGLEGRIGVSLAVQTAH